MLASRSARYPWRRPGESSCLFAIDMLQSSKVVLAPQASQAILNLNHFVDLTLNNRLSHDAIMSFSFGFSGDDVEDDGAGQATVSGDAQSNGGEQFEGLPAMEHRLDELVGMHCLSPFHFLGIQKSYTSVA